MPAILRQSPFPWKSPNKVQSFNGSSPPWPLARMFMSSESATECVYEMTFTFYRIGFQSSHPDILGLGQGFTC
jgi:hypothetical protein